MIIIGIDPSYTRTGVCVLNTEVMRAKFYTISVSDAMVYNIAYTLVSARVLAVELYVLINNNNPSIVSIEYPVLATRSGAYLGLIQQAFYDLLCNFKYKGRVIMLPSQATNSVTKAKTKTDIVKWTTEVLSVKKTINHDEATAGVLACTAFKIFKGEYKNSHKEMIF